MHYHPKIAIGPFPSCNIFSVKCDADRVCKFVREQLKPAFEC